MKFLIVQKEVKRDILRNIAFYNLDAIISVGYRVNPSKATKFRIWTTKKCLSLSRNKYLRINTKKWAYRPLFNLS